MKPLTPREKQIAEMVARGMPNKRSACQLGISVKTVEFHLDNAARRIDGDASPRSKVAIWFYSLHIDAA
jgi:DNA-binding CsgD family transcriptional regulator